MNRHVRLLVGRSVIVSYSLPSFISLNIQSSIILLLQALHYNSLSVAKLFCFVNDCVLRFHVLNLIIWFRRSTAAGSLQRRRCGRHLRHPRPDAQLPGLLHVSPLPPPPQTLFWNDSRPSSLLLSLIVEIKSEFLEQQVMNEHCLHTPSSSLSSSNVIIPKTRERILAKFFLSILL